MQLFGIRATSIGLGFGLVAAGLGILGAGSNGPAPTRYEVTAELLLASDGKVYACYAYLQSFPPAACGGIEVLGVDLSQIRSVEGYPSGGQGSRPQRLVGTWALRVRGIDMLETMPCDSTTVGIVLVAADDKAVAWLTSHYRPIKVVGWLRPLPSGP